MISKRKQGYEKQLQRQLEKSEKIIGKQKKNTPEWNYTRGFIDGLEFAICLFHETHEESMK